MKKGVRSVMKIGNIVSYSILVVSVVLGKHLRDRRQATSNYVIDTLVVVDDVMYSSFQKMMVDSSLGQGADVNSSLKQYVSLIVRQANIRLATLQASPSYQISLQIVNISLNMNILGTAKKDKDGQIQSEDALENFRAWVTSAGLGNIYDHAILLTGYPLTSSASQDGEVTKGRSYVGKMCDQTGYSTTVVQENGGFQSVFFLVHELGHSLGAQHDETVPFCKNDRYIMTTDISKGVTPTNLDHPWYFSDCSTTAINSLVRTIASSSRPDGSSPDCLTSRSNPMAEFAATSESVSGQLYKADMQCQMIQGKQSRVCLGADFGRLDEICTSMYCLNAARTGDVGQCSQYVAAEGTSCGDKKWCNLGRCVDSDNAPPMDLSKCPYGDSVTKVNGKECALLVSENPRVCYNTDVNTTYCCASCEKIRSNSDCPYGDKSRGCIKDDCYSSENAPKCCATCANNGGTPTCNDTITIDGDRCEFRVNMDGRQGCYNSTVAKSCCLTCSKLHTGIKGCEYGDRLLDGSCIHLSSKNGKCSTTEGENCCQSCSSKGATITVVTTIWTILPISAFLTLWMSYNNVVQFL